MQGKKFLIFFFLSSLFFLIGGVSVQAVTVSPVKYVTTLAPGGSGVVSLEVSNDKTVSAGYNFLVLGVSQNPDGGFSFANNVSEAEGWVNPETTYLTVEPGGKKQINFLINVPDQAYPGFYFLGLAVQERNLDEAAIGLSGRVVVLLNLQVAGQAREVLQISKWSGAGLIGPFSLVLKNQGNVDLSLQGKMTVYNWQNKEVGTQDVYLGNQLLPNGERDYKLFFTNSLVWSPWYKVKLSVNYGRTNQIVQKIVLVNNIAWYFFLLFVLVILFGGFILRKYKRK